MVADTPCGPLYARLSVSEGDFGARAVGGAERPSGGRSAGRVGGAAPTMPAAHAPPRGHSGTQSAPQRPNGTQEPRGAKRPADGRTAALGVTPRLKGLR